MSEITEGFEILSHQLNILLESMNRLQKSRTDVFENTWIDTQEVTRLLKISKRSVDSMRNTGYLGYSKIKGKIYYNLQEVEEILKQNYVKSIRRFED